MGTKERPARSRGRALPVDHAATRTRRHKSRGQSIVELALALPIILVIVLTALDLGRAFMGWVVLNNTARVGASFAGLNPEAWGVAPDEYKLARYDQIVSDARDDAALVLEDCDSEAIPVPQFPSGDDLGDHVVVDVTCDFRPITPIIGDILTSGGGTIPVSARAVFPVRSGGIAISMPAPPPTCLSDFDVTTEGLTAHFTDTTPGASWWFWVFEGPESTAEQHPSYSWGAPGTYTVTLDAAVGSTLCTQRTREVTVEEPPEVSPDPSASAAPSASPVPDPLCTVPGFAGRHRNEAQGLWNAAGFSTTVGVVAGARSGNWVIEYQSLNSGNPVACNVAVTIGPDPLPTPAP